MFVLRGFPQFTTADPLGEDRRGLTPFSYAGNDPINLIDFNGLEPRDTKVTFRLKGSVGPQLGAEVKFGAVSVGGVARWRNVDGESSISVTNNQEKGWSVTGDYKSRDVYWNYGGGIDSPYLPFVTYDKERSKEPDHHSVFKETIETKQQGLIETIEKDTWDAGDPIKTKQENTVIKFGGEVNLFLIGFEVEIGIEHVGIEERVDEQNNIKNEEIKSK